MSDRQLRLVDESDEGFVRGIRAVEPLEYKVAMVLTIKVPDAIDVFEFSAAVVPYTLHRPITVSFADIRDLITNQNDMGAEIATFLRRVLSELPAADRYVFWR